MGAVYLAERIADGERVAFKVLLSEHALNEEFRSRFDRESRYAAALNHPNIVRVHEVGGTEDLSYMVMDFVDGSDLARKLAKEGRLEAAPTIEILEQLAGALDAVHETGLCHRDVKPANVVIDTYDVSGGLRCYLTDFGLSKRPSQDSKPLTAFGFFVGTLDYTAPEQIQGSDVDSPSRRLLTRLPAPRMPHRSASVPEGARGGGALRAPSGSAAQGDRPPARPQPPDRRCRRQGDGEGPRGALRDLRRDAGRRPSGDRPGDPGARGCGGGRPGPGRAPARGHARERPGHHDHGRRRAPHRPRSLPARDG